MFSRFPVVLMSLVAALSLSAGCLRTAPEPEALAHFLCYNSTALGSGACPTVWLKDQFYRDPVSYDLLPGAEGSRSRMVVR